jgi:hypothetical protein
VNANGSRTCEELWRAPDPVLTWTEVGASDDGKVAAVLFELAALGKSMSGDYEPADSKAD